MPSVAEAQELRTFAGKYEREEDLSDDPRLFAALSAWCYVTPGRPELGAWNSPALGFTAFDGRPNGPVPAPVSAPSGYDAGAFLHEASATLIVVNRGTEEWDDWGDNIQQYLSRRASQQSTDALEFAVRAVRRAQEHTRLRSVVLTGHSLGGGLAGAQFCLLARSLSAIATPVPEQLLGFTFGTAPFRAACLAFERERFPDDPPTATFTKLKNWRRRDDPLSALDPKGSATLGEVQNDLPAVWTVVRQPDPHGTRGARDWKYVSGTVSSHSAYLYFKYFDLRRDHHIVLRRNGEHFARPGREPNRPHAFNKLPDWA